MSEQQKQCSKLAGALTEHQHHFGAMSTEDRQWAIQNTVAAITLFAEAVKNRATIEVKKLLQFLFNFTAEAVEEFNAKEKFVEGKTVDGVSIYWLGENFKKNFCNKIEKNVAKTELKIHKLLEAARNLSKDDEPGIIPELGGKHETKLAQFFQILAYKQQKKDFTWVIAYIYDENGNLWTVGADWYSGRGGWFIGADSVDHPFRWDAGDQFVSR
ncbi:MAG: hypothetical protein NTY93_00530 [Candidatus Kaiserbacteria bacterium]|nr:hypothetical protein [Candidatus Kaiserbacteria bacterium]